MASYYVSQEVGASDANSGLTTLLPWLTVAKVNATSFAAGDIVSFRRGDCWSELLTVPTSGSAGNRITFRDYGSGARPIIQAADPVTGWTLDSAVAGGDRYKVVLGWAVTPIYLWTSDNTADTHVFRARASSLAACTAINTWWYESGTDTIYLVVATGAAPTDGGAVIHAGRRTNAVKASVGKSYIAVQGLNLRFCNTTLTTEALIQHTSTTVAANDWTIDDVVCQWGSGGICLKANTGTPWAATYSLSITNTEIKYVLAHGLAISFYDGATIQSVNIHDCGRQGAGLILRNSTIDSCRFDRCGNASDSWGAQSVTVQAYDHGLYLVGQPSPLAVASANVVSNCVATGNAKAGLATDAASDSNTFRHNVSYSNTLYGLFFEGGTENGSYGSMAYHNTLWNNGKSGIHVSNGMGNVNLRNNLLFGNGTDGSQDLFLRNEILGTWAVHSGAIYKRTTVRWAPATLGAPIGSVLTLAANVGAMVAGSWYYDTGATTLYVWKVDSSAVTAAYCTPATANVIDYNDYTPAASLPGGAKIARFDIPTASTNYTDLATMAAAEGFEAHGLQVDPLYVSAAAGIFPLQGASPVIDAGDVIAGINDGYSGAAPDMGYAEYGALRMRPVAPRGRRIRPWRRG